MARGNRTNHPPNAGQFKPGQAPVNKGVTEDLTERFWSKVVKIDDGCWLWTAALLLDGYGQIWLGQTMERAHRLSWIIHFGPIPEGLCVLHTCDNPPCVRPGHLFLGTQLDNVRDAIRKGRR